MAVDPKEVPDTPEKGEEAADFEAPIELEQPIEPGDADAQPT